MKAAIYQGKYDIQVKEVPIREIKDNEVLIKVKYCGVCGTDLHIYGGDSGSADVIPPVILGHEFSGVVDQAGDAVNKFKKGDRVTADPNDMCGKCYFCKNGKQHFCENHIGIGTTQDGAFAEYIIMREKQVYKVPDQLDLLEASMVEPLSCCIHGIDMCQIKSGDTVLVIGGGPIGIIMMQLAKKAGATSIIVSEPVEEKRKTAKQLGATLTVDPFNDDIKDILNSNFKNVDVVMECAGNVRAIYNSLEYAGKGAKVLLFGMTGPEADFPLYPDIVFKKELTITSSFINPYTYERAIKVLASGEIRVKEIIANIILLPEIEKVFTDKEYRKSGKVVIQI